MRPEFVVIIVVLMLCGAVDWFLCAACDDADRNPDTKQDTWRDK